MTFIQFAALSLPIMTAVAIIAVGRMMTKHDQRAYDLREAKESALNSLKSGKR